MLRILASSDVTVEIPEEMLKNNLVCFSTVIPLIGDSDDLDAILLSLPRGKSPLAMVLSVSDESYVHGGWKNTGEWKADLHTTHVRVEEHLAFFTTDFQKTISIGEWVSSGGTRLSLSVYPYSDGVNFWFFIDTPDTKLTDRHNYFCILILHLSKSSPVMLKVFSVEQVRKVVTFAITQIPNGAAIFVSD